jgi:hypothetical protein
MKVKETYIVRDKVGNYFVIYLTEDWSYFITSSYFFYGNPGVTEIREEIAKKLINN